MKKFIKILLFYFPLVFLTLLVLSIFFIVPGYLSFKLNQGLQFGNIHVKSSNFGVSPNYNIDFDSLILTTPTGVLNLAEGKVKTSFISFGFNKSPFADVIVDSMSWSFIPMDSLNQDSITSDTLVKNKALPNLKFKIPVKFNTNFAEIKLLNGDTVRVDSLIIQNKSSNEMFFQIKNISSSNSNIPKFSWKGSVNQKDPDWMKVDIKGGNQEDKLNIITEVNKINPSFLKIKLRGELSEFLSFVNTPKIIQEINPHGLTLDLQIKFDSLFDVQGDINLSFDKFMFLNNHDVSINLFQNRKGLNFKITSLGLDEDKIFLSGYQPIKGKQNLENLIESLENFNVRFSGVTEDVSWELGGKILPVDADITNARLNKGGINVNLVTSDGSNVDARMKWKNGFKMSSNILVSPQESWATAWTDTNVQYDHISATVNWSNNKLYGKLKALNLNAYGANFDSLITDVKLDDFHLEMVDAEFYHKKEKWDSHGTLVWKKGSQNIDIVFDHPRYGHMSYKMPKFQVINADAENVDLENVPYKYIGKINKFKPKVSGHFEWDLEEQFGKTSLKSNIQILEKPVDIALNCYWNKNRLSIPKLNVEHQSEKLSLYGNLSLNGKPFYEAYKAELDDVSSFELEMKNVNFAPWLEALDQAALHSLKANGSMNYFKESGFSGSFLFSDIEIPSVDHMFRISKLRLNAQNWLVKIDGNTLSQEHENLNTSFQLQANNIKSEDMVLEAKIKSNNQFNFNSTGLLKKRKHLQLMMRGEGKIHVSEELGYLSDTKMVGRLNFPINNAKKMNLEAKLEKGRFVLKDGDTLSLATLIKFNNQKVDIKNLSIKNALNEELAGGGAYSLANKKGDLNFKTEALTIKLPKGHKFSLKKAFIGVSTDSIKSKVVGDFSNGIYNYAQGNVKIKTEMPNVSLIYTIPHQGEDVLKRNKLNVNASVDNFLLTHEVDNLDDIFSNLKGFFTFRWAKKKKRKKVELYQTTERPFDVQMYVNTKGSKNRIQSEYFRGNFEGEVTAKGTYPYLLLNGQTSVIEGEFYKPELGIPVQTLDMRWENDPFEEGELEMVANKPVAQTCEYQKQPDSCFVEILVNGKLNGLEFSSGGNCSDDFGGSWGPVEMITTVARGCYQEKNPNLVGTGVQIVETMVNTYMDRNVTDKITLIDELRLEGSQHILSGEEGDTNSINDDINASEAVSISVQSKKLKILNKDYLALRFIGKLGYDFNSSMDNPYEWVFGIEHYPYFEDIKNPTLKRRLQDRIKLEGKLKSSPGKQIDNEEKDRDFRGNVGINYNYEFWKIW